MAIINVQFSDATETAIIAIFSCPQSTSAFPNQGQVVCGDARYATYYASIPASIQALLPAPTGTITPSPAQQAASMLASGIAITSTGTPALNATYAVDQPSQMDIIAIETSLNAGKGFPGGATNFNFPDITGAMHSFSAANFTNFAAAVRDYVYALKSVIAGASQTLPAGTASIS